MIHVTAILEDLVIVGERREKDWHVRVCDMHLGNSGEVALTDSQFGAVIGLATAGDEWEGRETLRDGLYEIARQGLGVLPQALWPIP
jgi:hypothetical protein